MSVKQPRVRYLSRHLYKRTVEYERGLPRPGDIDRMMADQFVDIIREKIKIEGKDITPSRQDSITGRYKRSIAHFELHIMTSDELRQLMHDLIQWMKEPGPPTDPDCPPIAADPLGLSRERGERDELS